MWICAILVVVAAGVVYSLYLPVPPGTETSTRILFTILRALDRMGTLLEWMGITDRLYFAKKFTSVKPKPVEEQLYKDVQTEDTEFDGVKVRIFTPNQRTNKAGIVHIHGGGWCVNSVDMYDELCRKMAFDMESLVVSIEYRLAPKYPYPIPYDDCLAATKHFLKTTSQYGVDPQKVAIVGDSAGGNLAAAITLSLRDENFSPALKAQVLMYPVTQSLDHSLPSYQQNGKGPILTSGWIAAFRAQYALGYEGATYEFTQKFTNTKHVTADVRKKMADTKLRRDLIPKEFQSSEPIDLSEGDSELWNKIKDRILDQNFSPLLADDLSSLPAAYVLTGQYDVLRDEGIMYARRLQEAGNDVTWSHSSNGYHDMLTTLHINKQRQAMKHYQEVIDFMKIKLK